MTERSLELTGHEAAYPAISSDAMNIHEPYHVP